MVQLQSVTIHIEGKGYNIGAPGKLTRDRCIPIGSSVQDLLLANEGKRLDSLAIQYDDEVDSLNTGPRVIDEALATELGQQVTRLLGDACSPFWKKKRRPNG